MPYPLFVIDDLKEKSRRWEPGAMWFIESYGPDGEHRGVFLDSMASLEYKRDWADKRSPICVCLPGGGWWTVDQKPSNGSESGWTVTGDAPNLTAQPSINAEGLYHGWLKDGVLSDDLEGRTYGAE